MSNETLQNSEAQLRRQRLRAILAITAAAASFAVAAALVKAIAPEIPTVQIVFFRSVVALALLIPLLARLGGLRALATKRPWWHAVRTITGFGGMFTAFYGYAHLPLAAVSALGFTMPLFLTALSIPLLGETVGIRRASAVVVGFLGVLLILRPWGAELDLVAALIVVFGAMCWAVSMVAIRRMGESGESNVAIIAWFSIGALVVSGVPMVPVWVTPDLPQLAALVGVGVVSTVAQLMMTEAYRRGETTLVAPFEYSGILWTALIGLVVWNEKPDAMMVAGVAVLVGSGLYILHREVVRGAGRARGTAKP